MRKRALLLAVSLTFGLGGHVRAEDKVLYVAGAGGSQEQTLRTHVFPAFEAKTGTKIVYVAGNSTDLLAKLQAQKGNQQIDVAMIDDGPMYQAVSLGFCRPLDTAPVFDDLYDVAKFPSGKAVAFGVVGTGLIYNAKLFKENNWSAPTSWLDLQDPRYKGKLVIPPLNNTYGLLTLVEFARLNGGSETNVEPGFKAIKERVGPNVLVYEPSPGKMTELFQSGQVVLGVWGSGRAKALADTGFPAAFTYPKEGGLAIAVGICPVAGGPEKPEAQQFLQYILSPDVQVALATGAGFGPVNKKAVLTEAQQVGLPYGPAQVGTLQTINWDIANANREAWNRRWVREIER
jgi:putative spermidine/putrescine transport system substrate-binding protein